jgi:hypothetical protein
MDRLQQGAAAEAMVEAARNPGGGAGAFMGAGVGMALGQQMGNVMAAGQQGGYGQPQQGGYPPSAGPPPLPQAQTFHAEINGQAAGPFTIDQLRQFATAGQLNPNSNVWASGMPNWVAAQAVPALAPLFAPPSPPPLPPRGQS